MTFKVLLHKKASKFLNSLDKRTRDKLIESLRLLESFPKSGLDLVKVSGEENVFRARIGRFRALFKVYEEEELIVVIKIDMRRRIYKG